MGLSCTTSACQTCQHNYQKHFTKLVEEASGLTSEERYLWPHSPSLSCGCPSRYAASPMQKLAMLVGTRENTEKWFLSPRENACNGRWEEHKKTFSIVGKEPIFYELSHPRHPHHTWLGANSDFANHDYIMSFCSGGTHLHTNDGVGNPLRRSSCVIICKV